RAKESNNGKALVGAYNKHGLVAKRLKRWDEAISAFRSAINIIDSLDYKLINHAFVMGNLGSCYYAQGKLNQAYNCLTIDAAGSLMGKQTSSYLNAELILVEIDIQRRNLKKATNRLDTILVMFQDHLGPIQRLAATEQLMKLHKAKGNEIEYNFYTNQWMELNKQEFKNKAETHQKLVHEYAANSLKHVTEQIETEKQLLAQKLIVRQKETEKNQLKNWLIIIGLTLVLSIAIFGFLRYRSILKLKQAQLYTALKDQEILELKVKEESRNVQSLSLELQVKQEFSSSLINQLKQYENLTNSDLKNIEIYIQNELDVKSTRAQLQNQMGDLSSEFYNSLKINYPQLTEVDLKLAAMIAMDMSNKEIAISKNISTESVKKTKYRLKKKLNLTTDVDLTLHLKKEI
ncbi:MAG: tetratricopeptide repeat protein, partial [Flavobacteriales bacterium]|nr:tetratricopeptide repeat protein [Flavobacteriales bacterium]